jgi:DNA-binding transcriptional regulator YiaG
MTMQFHKIDGGAPEGMPLHYTACGLDDVYLVNGFKQAVVDGDEFVTIEDLDNLWKAIGLHLVTKKKVLAPKEIRFLREHMDFTQAELGARLRVSDQTIARWEKGLSDPDGPADFALRAVFLACTRAQPEGGVLLAELVKSIEKMIQRDEQEKPTPVIFRHRRRNWTEEERQPQLEYA